MSGIGVFGGAFDPIHTGHLAVAQDVAAALELERVLFVPTANPPHRKEGPFAPGPARIEMVRAATGSNDRFDVWTGEFDRAGPSYTVDTLRTLANEFPDSRLHLIVGADQFSRFDSWRDPEVISALSQVVVVGRSGNDGSDADNGVVPVRVDVPRLEVSSSGIRERVALGRPIRYLVPEPVVRIIEEQGWYKNG